MSSINKILNKKNKCVALVLVVLLVFMCAPFDIYMANDSQTALVSDATMFSGAWDIAGPYRNATTSLIDESYVGWENDDNNYFVLKTSSGTYYPPNNLCKFYFRISADFLVEASGDLLVEASCRPYIVYNGERYEAIKVDNVYVCSFYAQGNSNMSTISTPVQFDVDVFDNATSSSSYSVTFQIKSITWSCWSVQEEEEVLLDSMLAYLEEMAGDNDTIKSYLSSIKSSISSTVSKLTTLNNYASGILTGITTLTTEIQELQTLVDVTNDYLAKIQAELENQTTELKTQTGILGSISGWIEDIYDGLFNNNLSDSNQDFSNTSNSQSSDLGGLIGDMEYDRPDIEDVNVNVNQYISVDDVSTVGDLLSIITNNVVIKTFLLVSFSVALVGYGLFGKR